ncbi:MAG: FtsH protease activity modulator HflK [Burkholderiaceae bacterium]
MTLLDRFKLRLAGLGQRWGVFNQGPPDLDQVWRDFTRKLDGLFGRKGGSDSGGTGGGGMQGPSPKAAGIGVSVVLVIAALIWLGSGFYIVQEGRSAVVSQFGKYLKTVGAGFNWRLPYPIQTHQIVNVSQLQRVEIGTRSRPQRLKEALMLTDDENIADIQFEVQYRIKADGAADYVFNNRRPDDSVMQAAESAMREAVGRKTMDSVLYESRSEIATEVQKRMQQILDRYKTGILITAVAIQNAQPPEQVQAAFDDAVKAGQDRERAINEGQAYANDVIPRARGTAARLLQEAEGYKSRVTETAEGDAARFRSVVAEYQRAPGVTRERIYLETMQSIFQNTTKVMVDTKGGNNLLSLPLDRLMQQVAADAARASAAAPPPASVINAPTTSTPEDNRARDALRNREGRQ